MSIKTEGETWRDKMGLSPQISRRYLIMKKLFKRISVVCLAAIMMVTVLCTYAFAAGNVTVSRSGNAGNYTVEYSYTDVDRAGTSAGGFITGNYTTYSISFTPVLGTSAIIYIRNHDTKVNEVTITAPQVVSGGMPDSFSVSRTLKPNTRYDILFKSGSTSVKANGSVTIPHIDVLTV